MDAADLTEIGSTTLTLNDVLSNVAEFRILNSTNPALNGDRIASRLGVDNIEATVIPEASSFALLLVGCGMVGLTRLLHRRSAR